MCFIKRKISSHKYYKQNTKELTTVIIHVYIFKYQPTLRIIIYVAGYESHLM